MPPGASPEWNEEVEAMASTKQKTWTQVENEIAETFRLWPNAAYAIDSVFCGARAGVRRRAGMPGQTDDERAVTLRWAWRDRGRERQVTLTMVREPTALENLILLAKAIEWLRMAYVRRIDGAVLKMLRQLYPEPQRTTPPPPPPPRAEAAARSSGPAAVLHIANDAPLAVAEAAYRALARHEHPDVGGSTATMQQLNAAIEAIRTRATARV